MSSLTPVTFSIPMDDLKCGLTADYFRDPVMDIHGHIFEREALISWADASAARNEPGECTCPVTRQPIKIEQLYPALTVKAQAEAARFAEEHPEGQPKLTMEQSFAKVFQFQDKMVGDMNGMAFQMSLLNRKVDALTKDLGKETEKTKIQFIQLENILEINFKDCFVDNVKWAFSQDFRKEVLARNLTEEQVATIRDATFAMGAKYDANPAGFFNNDRRV